MSEVPDRIVGVHQLCQRWNEDSWVCINQVIRVRQGLLRATSFVRGALQGFGVHQVPARGGMQTWICVGVDPLVEVL